MQNPFDAADFIRVCHDPMGYYLEIISRYANVRINCGPDPRTVATIFVANNVQHFDYDSSITNEQFGELTPILIEEGVA